MGADEIAVQAALKWGADEVCCSGCSSVRAYEGCSGCSSVGADEVAVQAALQWGLMRLLFRLHLSGG